MFEWEQNKNKKRAIAKKDIVMRSGCFLYEIKKGTKTAWIDSFMSLPESSWISSGVSIDSNSEIGNNVIIIGDIDIKYTKICDNCSINGILRQSEQKDKPTIIDCYIADETSITIEDGARLISTRIAASEIGGKVKIFKSRILNSEVCGSARIENASISDSSKISGKTEIFGDVYVSNSQISNTGKITSASSCKIENSSICGDICIDSNNVEISDSELSGYVKITSSSIFLNCVVSGEVSIGVEEKAPTSPLCFTDAKIKDEYDFFIFRLANGVYRVVYSGKDYNMYFSFLNRKILAKDAYKYINKICFNLDKDYSPEPTAYNEWRKWAEETFRSDEAIKEYQYKQENIILDIFKEYIFPEPSIRKIKDVMLWSMIEFYSAVNESISKSHCQLGNMDKGKIKFYCAKFSRDITIDLAKKAIVVRPRLFFTEKAIDWLADILGKPRAIIEDRLSVARIYVR